MIVIMSFRSSDKFSYYSHYASIGTYRHHHLRNSIEMITRFVFFAVRFLFSVFFCFFFSFFRSLFAHEQKCSSTHANSSTNQSASLKVKTEEMRIFSFCFILQKWTKKNSKYARSIYLVFSVHKHLEMMEILSFANPMTKTPFIFFGHSFNGHVTELGSNKPNMKTTDKLNNPKETIWCTSCMTIWFLRKEQKSKQICLT